jgi:hypothetical protein
MMKSDGNLKKHDARFSVIAGEGHQIKIIHTHSLFIPEGVEVAYHIFLCYAHILP